MELRLIEAVRQHPCLYAKNAADYNNKCRKAKAWKAVEAEVHVKVDFCRSRWRSLRDRYVREIAKKSRLGNAASTWIYLESLSFLKTHIKPKEPTSPYVDNDDFNNFKSSPKSSSEGYISYEQHTTTTPSKRKRLCPSNSPSFDMELSSFPCEYEEETTSPFDSAQLPPKEHYKYETYVSGLPELASLSSCSENDTSQPSTNKNPQTRANERLNSSLDDIGGDCVALNRTQLEKSECKSRNDDYYKVLDTYMRKLSEADQDEVKIEILNMVFKKSINHLT